MQCGQSSDKRILGFDGLRAIAFVLVFISHKYPNHLTEAMGTSGLWLFFVLSGFLITRNLASLRAGIESGLDTFRGALKDFYIRRTARIFPAFYALLLVATLLATAGYLDLGPMGRQISNALFVSNIYIEQHGWVGALGHLWSLAVEEQFYVLFAPLVLLTRTANLKRLCVALLTASLVAHAYHWSSPARAVVFDVDSFFNFGLLAIGGLAGLSANAPLPRFLTSETAMALNLLVLPAIPVLVVATTSTLVWLLMGQLVSVLYALLLLQVFQRQSSRTVSLLNAPSLRYVGLVSYGAYLYHLMILQGLAELLHLQLMQRSVSTVIEFALTIVISAASYRWLENPIRTLARPRKALEPASP